MLFIIMGCDDKKSTSKDAVIMEVSDKNYESLDHETKEEMNDLKKLLPKSSADTLVSFP